MKTLYEKKCFLLTVIKCREIINNASLSNISKIKTILVKVTFEAMGFMRGKNYLKMYHHTNPPFECVQNRLIFPIC